MKKILLAFTGSIASIKAQELVFAFQKKNFQVQCVVSNGGDYFCDTKKLEKITGLPVLGPRILENFGVKNWSEENFRDKNFYQHLFASRNALAIVIAPASVNTMAKLSTGLADDFLSALVLAAQCPVFFAPAANTQMLSHPLTQNNIDILKNVCRYHEIPAQENGVLACGEEGFGKMAPVEIIVDIVETFLDRTFFLQGKKFLINAGGTREKIDPVRYIGNFSTGKTGKILAEIVQRFGGNVELVVGNTTENFSGFACTRVHSAQEMLLKMEQQIKDVDVVIFSAAVADFSVKNFSPQKLKKSEQMPILELTPNVDIAKKMSTYKKENQFFIGFCLETGSTEDLKLSMIKKAESKKFDVVFGNTPENFGTKKGKFFVYFTKENVFLEKEGEKEKTFEEVFLKLFSQESV